MARPRLSSQSEERQPLLNDREQDAENGVQDQSPTTNHNSRNSINKIGRLTVSLLLLFAVLSSAIWLGLRSALPGSHDLPDSPSPSPSSWENIRLPDWIHPTHYKLWLETDLQNFAYWGNVTISCDVTNVSTTFIVVHQLELDVKFTSLISQSDNESYSLKSVENKTNHEQLVFVFDRVLKPGPYKLQLSFAGTLKDNLEGFYYSQFLGNDGLTHYLATTQFEPVNARRAFPCLDEPAKKAVFDITIVAHKQYHALSNMPVAHVEHLENDRRAFVFQPTVRMASYLVAFIVSDFEGISTTTSNGINITVYTRPRSTHLGKYALETSAAVMDFYQNKYGIDFPLPKCDFIAIPDFSAGAMENWGLITFRDTALLYDPEASDANNKKRVATVIAHELAHQWFGNLVTMKWWNDLWLNEGFAEFMEYKGTDAVEPSWQMEAQFVPADLIRALNADDSLFTHSIAVLVKDPAEIQNIFDDISYGKGSSVLRMLEDYLERSFGSSYFFARLHKYLSDHAYSNAETHELWESLGSSITNVSRFMSTWTDQPGLPLLKISDPVLSESGSNYSIHISQERFLFANLVNITENVNMSEIPVLVRPPQNISNQLWAIPFSYTPITLEKGKIRRHDGALKPVEFYEHGPLSVELGDLKRAEKIFVLANLGQTGVYRVQYSNEAYALLGSWLHKDVNILKPSERAGFVSDVFTLMFSGKIKDVKVGLEFIRFLENDENPIVWEAALSEFKTLKKVFALNELYGSVSHFINTIMDHIIKSLGWIESSNGSPDSELRSMIRGPVLQEAVRNGHPAVVSKALDFFSRLRKDKHFLAKQKVFSAESLAAILDAGVMYGDEDAYKWVLTQYKNSQFASDQLRFLNALSSTREPHLQTETLNLALTGQIRRQDLTTLIYRVAQNTPIGHVTTWLFVMDHWNTIAKTWGGGDFSKFNDVLQNLVSRFTNPSLMEQVERLFLKKDDPDFFIPPNSVVSIVKGLERSKQLHAWRELVSKDLKDWFDKEVNSRVIEN